MAGIETEIKQYLRTGPKAESWLASRMGMARISDLKRLANALADMERRGIVAHEADVPMLDGVQIRFVRVWRLAHDP